MSKLIEFYLGEGDSEGRYLKDIWDWNNEDLEFFHDWVQWLFPTKEPSLFNPEAPILDEETIKEWHRDRMLQHNLRCSYERWLLFCGVARHETGLCIVNFNNDVWPRLNHNWWRITRIIKSLKTLGLEQQAEEFYSLLDNPKIPADEQTKQHWLNAKECL